MASRTVHRYAVDERLVMPESPFEVVDGELVHVPGADPPHATRHSKLSALLEAYVARGFAAASDMLTRTSPTSDFAPDASIYPSAKDPATGGRQLEHLAFEIVSKQRLAKATRKAELLALRGVRRVFAIDVKRERALEWSRKTKSWEILSSDAVIDDAALVLPPSVRDLVSAATVDDAIARALLAKNNPVLVSALTKAESEAKREDLLTVLRSRGLRIGPQAMKSIRSAEMALLDRWLSRAATCESVRDLLASTLPPKKKLRARRRAQRSP